MAEYARLQVKTSTDPEKWEDVGALGLSIPVTMTGNTDVSGYQANDVEQLGTTYYVGQESVDGDWLLLQIIKTSPITIRYATIANNAGVLTYSSAWTNRATLTYDLASVAL